jgi:hypothetical protein
MADAITYKAASHKFACGSDLTNLTVINFVGPEGSKASAYSCNMNVDLDGEPQAYAPLSKPQLRPKDNLGNAGWKTAGGNDILRQQYESGKKVLADLEQKRGDAVTKSGKPAPAPGKPASDPAVAALDVQIKHQKEVLRRISFENTDANGNYSKVNPKNFEKIFWKWYGVTALTPEQAQAASPYMEMPSMKLNMRRPVLDQSGIYEDVFGRFPVVQSVFEPGPGYFVTPLPRGANSKYPSWDQRYFLPHDTTNQTAFGALAVPLGSATGLHLNDKVFAIRLDTTDTLEFPFRDTGFGYKVAECSFAAFTGLGGVYHPEKNGAAKFPNDFLLLYLAFPGGQTPAAVLAKFAQASNADDFAVILSFLAQATVDAKAKHSKAVGGDPIKAFEAWKKSPAGAKPSTYDVITQGLGAASAAEFVERFLRKHPSVLSAGSSLQLKP